MTPRPARPEEAPRLTAIMRAAKAHWGYAPAALHRWRAELTLTARDIATRSIFVVGDGDGDGDGVGEGTCAGAGDDPVAFAVLGPGSAVVELEHLWVDPPHMKKGLGRLLLGHAVATARARGARELIVDSDPHAEPFYLACGAVRVGTLPAALPDDPTRVRPQLRIEL